MSDGPRLIIRLDASLCIGSGMCAGSAPAAFALGADRHSYPLAEQIDFDQAVLDAAASCPVEAITVLDAGTGDPVPLD
jgi:ferredoxin